MTRIFAGGVLALALGIGTALAADPLASFYGNTLLAKDKDGNVTKIWYSPDNTFKTAMGDQQTKGTWEMKGEEVCVTQTEPAPAADQQNPFCFTESEARKVGDTWTVNDPDGNPITLTLQSGS
jgi:hypothetical protein